MPRADSNAKPNRVPFWRVFAQSRIPMALVDDERRYVNINDAAVQVFRYSRDEVIGERIGRTALGDPSTADAQWEQLMRTDELYGERIVAHANGTRMRVSFAAHATTIGKRWLALFVTLSARVQPGGPELIGRVHVESADGSAQSLTLREREVVRLVALGSDTRGIAGDLCISPETVRTHVRNAMTKTGAHTRAQLVAVALADRLIDD
jgi:PAS domain S-box-containing protein